MQVRTAPPPDDPESLEAPVSEAKSSDWLAPPSSRPAPPLPLPSPPTPLGALPERRRCSSPDGEQKSCYRPQLHPPPPPSGRYLGDHPADVAAVAGQQEGVGLFGEVGEGGDVLLGNAQRGSGVSVLRDTKKKQVREGAGPEERGGASPAATARPTTPGSPSTWPPPSPGPPAPHLRGHAHPPPVRACLRGGRCALRAPPHRERC